MKTSLSSTARQQGLCLIIVLTLSSLAALFFFRYAAFIPAKAMAITIATAVVTTGYLIFGSMMRQTHGSVVTPLINSLQLGGCAFLLLLIMLPTPSLELTTIINITIGTTTLGFLLFSVTGYYHALHHTAPAPVYTVLFIACIFATAIVWASPWAEHYSNQVFTNAVICLNPLSYLAVMTNYDYLHSQWFYVNVPYGSIRYAYPDKITYTLTLVLFGVLFLIGTANIKRKRLNRPGAVNP